jgi:hypothetical protein
MHAIPALQDNRPQMHWLGQFSRQAVIPDGGCVAHDERLSLYMDYHGKQRLKIDSRLRFLTADENPPSVNGLSMLDRAASAAGNDRRPDLWRRHP